MIKSFKYLHKAMDTEFSVVIRTEDESLAAAAANDCFRRVDYLESLLSRFQDTSDVAVIGALKPNDIAVIAPETMQVLVKSAEVCASTMGAFDPTLAARNFSALTLDVENCRVKASEKVLLDFGGIGKGYALDECAKILVGECYGFTDWLLDAGTSTVLVSGGPWSLGVGGPYKLRTRKSCKVELTSGALSGSGFEIQGAHIRDPRTGNKASAWEQSWVFANDGITADALSTAVLSLSSSGIVSACKSLNARVIVARSQSPFFDRFRDPLVSFG